MRLLLHAWLAKRAKLRWVRDLFTDRAVRDQTGSRICLSENASRRFDRSMLAQSVPEIAAVQRRMDNGAAHLPADAWAEPAGG